MIDPIARPLRIYHRRQFRSGGRDECPVSLIRRALLNPLFDQLFLSRRDLETGVGRRHQLVFIVGNHALIRFALFRMAAHNRRPSALKFVERALRRVEPQILLAFGGVKPMTFEASVGKNRADIPIELHPRGKR